MDDPVLVEVTRGSLVESEHRGAVAVVDADGGVLLEVGDIDRPVFPRSAVKAFQALPLFLGGAADRLGFTDEEIALACASHSGEPAHVAAAAGMLARVGRDDSALECGSHWPLREKAARQLAAEGRRPCPFHNNCSGKHAGFVCLACDAGRDPAGYVAPGHWVQQQVRCAIEVATGSRLDDGRRAVDGCSIPTWAIPLRALARGFARFGAGQGLPGEFAAAAARIRAAVAAHPFMVAGTGRFDTALMDALGPRVFSKTGAEGVFCAAIPERGLGIALKVRDGTGRASECVLAALVERLIVLDGPEAGVVGELARKTLRNWKGIAVGEVRPAGPLA